MILSIYVFTLQISKDNIITTSAQEHCILYICRGILDLGWAFMGYIPVDEYNMVQVFFLGYPAAINQPLFIIKRPFQRFIWTN